MVEGFEACEFFHDGFWDLLPPARTEESRVLGEEAEHPMLPKASCQIAHGFGVHLGFLGPLRGGAIAKEHQRPNHLIPPLDVIDKVQLELGKIGQGVHQRFSPLSHRWDAGAKAKRASCTRAFRGCEVRGRESI